MPFSGLDIEEQMGHDWNKNRVAMDAENDIQKEFGSSRDIIDAFQNDVDSS